MLSVGAAGDGRRDERRGERARRHRRHGRRRGHHLWGALLDWLRPVGERLVQHCGRAPGGGQRRAAERGRAHRAGAGLYDRVHRAAGAPVVGAGQAQVSRRGRRQEGGAREGRGAPGQAAEVERLVAGWRRVLEAGAARAARREVRGAIRQRGRARRAGQARRPALHARLSLPARVHLPAHHGGHLSAAARGLGQGAAAEPAGAHRLADRPRDLLCVCRVADQPNRRVTRGA